MSQKDVDILDGFITRIIQREKRSFRRTLVYLALPIIMGIILIVYSTNELKGASSRINELQSQLATSNSQIQGLKAQLADIQKPIIRITEVPPSVGGPDEISLIRGEVKAANPEDYRVVIYALTDKWYVQPYVQEPFATIQWDGKWMTDTHLGRKYAALLVKRNFTPPSVYSTLPLVGENVMDITVVSASE
jgi:hypothetical protein